MDFETKRQEVEVKLQRELSDEYQKIQVCNYFDNEKVDFVEVVIHIVDDWGNREVGLISFRGGMLTEVIGQINGSTIRTLQKIINEEN